MQLTVVHPVTEVRVTPRLSTIWIGREQAFAATLTDSVSRVLTDRLVTWSSSDTTRAVVTASGVVTARREGLVTITATAEGLSHSASVDLFPEPAAAITITFDDAWRGVLQHAAPILDSLRLRGNVSWMTNVDWSAVMVPEELRLLQSSGWSILSHTMTHPYLTRLSLDSASREIRQSRERIVSLGFDPRVFIVPYLDRNEEVLAVAAAAGYTYTRCCAEDVWSTDTLVAWPIRDEVRHRLVGIDVTNYEGVVTTYNFRTASGRSALRTLLRDAVARRKFVDVFFHDIIPEDVDDLRETLAMIAEFRPYLITYGMLP
jgi:peptidoglycan/xylan/chitin deacetylase (PgdA/CDA1 family)